MTDPSVGPIYVDTSALAKAVRVEPESAALRSDLASRVGVKLVSSELLLLEMRRLGRRENQLESCEAAARQIALLPLDAEILESAGGEAPMPLSALDAIHFATLLRIANHRPVAGVLTYDHELRAAAEAAGFVTMAPGYDPAR
ncbi:MAG: PIN domain-containing protein [Thermoleophilaceae bacterium]|nr:PIN domain-containing protein [Thermoleophilaceae bacterium]